MWSININLRVLKVVNFAVAVDVIVGFAVVVVFVNAVVVILFVVTDHIIFSCGL